MEAGGKKYTDMAPGLEQVIDAGDTLVMRDNDGNEFAVTARIGPEMLDFIKAFDEWFIAQEKLVKGPVMDALWYKLKTAFNELPMSVQSQLPSFRSMGVSLGSGHDHV